MSVLYVNNLSCSCGHEIYGLRSTSLHIVLGFSFDDTSTLFRGIWCFLDTCKSVFLLTAAAHGKKPLHPTHYGWKHKREGAHLRGTQTSHCTSDTKSSCHPPTNLRCSKALSLDYRGGEVFPSLVIIDGNRFD